MRPKGEVANLWLPPIKEVSEWELECFSLRLVEKGFRSFPPPEGVSRNAAESSKRSRWACKPEPEVKKAPGLFTSKKKCSQLLHIRRLSVIPSYPMETEGEAKYFYIGLVQLTTDQYSFFLLLFYASNKRSLVHCFKRKLLINLRSGVSTEVNEINDGKLCQCKDLPVEGQKKSCFAVRLQRYRSCSFVTASSKGNTVLSI